MDVQIFCALFEFVSRAIIEMIRVVEINRIQTIYRCSSGQHVNGGSSVFAGPVGFRADFKGVQTCGVAGLFVIHIIDGAL